MSGKYIPHDPELKEGYDSTSDLEEEVDPKSNFTPCNECNRFFQTQNEFIHHLRYVGCQRERSKPQKDTGSKIKAQRGEVNPSVETGAQGLFMDPLELRLGPPGSLLERPSLDLTLAIGNSSRGIQQQRVRSENGRRGKGKGVGPNGGRF
ncbi:hypothetical protein Acr_28g0010070 [Actinidia rufa]|uniref:C2H2-type domain-containing protein n=1 Tax=Actinidia rufa TaxID=165716 RepID=A0A7J0HB25_9ERIC|nr:hypothetical protein Acr_28g0010070 [Actinidia rufa]